MIIGSGLLARAFANNFLQRDDVCIYAAGVSNSSCTDYREFAREQQRLSEALNLAKNVATFVYFGTCSVIDPEVIETPYVKHKLAMEQVVRSHEGNLILRLPQVAGVTPNPHTILNFLYARISRSESFNLWRNAKRNIIDIADVVTIANLIIEEKSHRNFTYNIANLINYSMFEIVKVIELICKKKAVYQVVERGSEYHIDTTTILPLLRKSGINFDDFYLEKTVAKYYSKV